MSKKPQLPRPHIIYGKMTEPQLIQEFKILTKNSKHTTVGKPGEIKKELERRRLKRLYRVNREEYNKRMLEKPSQDINNEKQSTLPRGMTPMQEKFCMEYAGTGNELDAYIKAGFKEDINLAKTKVRARQLLKNEKIQARIEEYQQEALKKIAWTKERVLDKLSEVYTESLKDSDFTNANRSMENIAKHLGMFVDVSKIEQTVKTTGFESGDKRKDIQKLADIAGFKLIDGGSKTIKKEKKEDNG
jgi:phage terminase small subunit|tara:strand:+ start:278 stop:1012 length:735 start_codon:yes stop_codon:yes gene_type:complete